jgi:hypothetical protein
VSSYTLFVTQFGAGPELAAQCPQAPTPDGWRNWVDADGPVPDALAKRATAIGSDPGVPLGTTESFPLPGVTTLIRVEPRVWSRNDQGALVQGCFRSAGIYLPSGSAAAGGITAPSDAGLNRTVDVLTVVSLAVGTVATLAAWGRK